MNLAQLSDLDLHRQIKQMVAQERLLLTKILHHLKEIERRRLYSDFCCSSLFAYAVKMLGYSEGQAQRRIQAMRLMKEIPAIEEKIADGSLSLSNIAQAQTAFNELKRQNNQQPVSKTKKQDVLSKLENMSAREGQRELLKILPEVDLPRERQRAVGDGKTEIKFLMDENLRQKLEEIRSLLGPKGTNLTYAKLFSCMAEISICQLKAKAFGKKRAKSVPAAKAKPVAKPIPKPLPTSKATPQPTLKPESLPTSMAKAPHMSKAKLLPKPKKSRYVSVKLKDYVWRRDQGRCTHCGGRRNLNLDHIVPFAKWGLTTPENLRLLCFHCNQRQAIKAFGREFIEAKIRRSRSSGS